MEFRIKLIVKCPMCGHLNKMDSRAYYKVEPGRPFIMTCDSEEGGCDRYFVAQINVVANVKTYVYEEPQNERKNINL